MSIHDSDLESNDRSGSDIFGDGLYIIAYHIAYDMLLRITWRIFLRIILRRIYFAFNLYAII